MRRGSSSHDTPKRICWSQDRNNNIIPEPKRSRSQFNTNMSTWGNRKKPRPNSVSQQSHVGWSGGSNVVGEPSRDGLGEGSNVVSQPSRDGWGGGARGTNSGIIKQDVRGWGCSNSVTKPVFGSPDGFSGDSLSSMTKSPCPKSLQSSFYLPSTKNEPEHIAITIVPYSIRKSGHDGLKQDPFKIFCQPFCHIMKEDQNFIDYSYVWIRDLLCGSQTNYENVVCM